MRMSVTGWDASMMSAGTTWPGWVKVIEIGPRATPVLARRGRGAPVDRLYPTSGHVGFARGRRRVIPYADVRHDDPAALVHGSQPLEGDAGVGCRDPLAPIPDVGGRLAAEVVAQPGR